MGVLFAAAVLLIGYAYVGYPFCLWVVASFRRRAPAVGGMALPPSATLLISAHNEEGIIGEKIENALSLDYPRESLEVLVVSDASDDRTDEIVKASAPRGVRLVRVEGRLGKSACLNRGVEAARGEVLVFSDANALYERQALRELVRPFGSADVGFVTGGTVYQAAGEEDLHLPVGLYASLEQSTKRLESELGSCVGADGAIFAIRSALWRPLEPHDLNDLVTPLGVVRRGARGVYQPLSRCVERTARSVGGEFNRQARITGRTLRALAGNRDLFNPLRHGLFAWELFSHKVCKLVVPFALILALASNLSLAPAGPLWRVILGLQLAGYAAGAAGLLRRGAAGGGGILGFPAVFLASSAAVLLGWLRFLQGETYTTWGTSR